jgi:quinolinate synthase
MTVRQGRHERIHRRAHPTVITFIHPESVFSIKQKMNLFAMRSMIYTLTVSISMTFTLWSDMTILLSVSSRNPERGMYNYGVNHYELLKQRPWH